MAKHARARKKFLDIAGISLIGKKFLLKEGASFMDAVDDELEEDRVAKNDNKRGLQAGNKEHRSINSV